MGTRNGRKITDEGVGILGRSLPPIDPASADNPKAAWLDPRTWFGQPEKPFEIEIGSGKGTFLVQQAEFQPETNFLGIEYAGEFYRYAADRLRRRGLPNVRMLYEDAVPFLIRRVPSEIAQVVHLYFSDPWPKSRHHKRRVVQDPFLEAAHRVLVPGGELRIVTDHLDYWAWMEEYFTRWTDPAREAQGLPFYTRHDFISPQSAGDGEVVGTNFERKYIPEGRTFNAATLRKPV